MAKHMIEVATCDACGRRIGDNDGNWGCNKGALYMGDAEGRLGTMSVFVSVRMKLDTSVPCDICSGCMLDAIEEALAARRREANGG